MGDVVQLFLPRRVVPRAGFKPPAGAEVTRIDLDAAARLGAALFQLAALARLTGLPSGHVAVVVRGGVQDWMSGSKPGAVAEELAKAEAALLRPLAETQQTAMRACLALLREVL